MRSEKSPKIRRGRVEETPRIDSFECGYNAFFVNFKLIPIKFRSGEFIHLDNAIIETTVTHGAADRTFFICPECRRRCRFLYLPEYKCRFCAKLNYGIQQRSRGCYENAALVLEKLNSNRKDIEDFIPEKPYYMHAVKYEKLLKRYLKYQKAYNERETAKLLRLIGGDWLEWALATDQLVD